MDERRHAEERQQRRNNELDQEHAWRCAKHEDIPWHVMKMQEHELHESRGSRGDSMATALLQQIVLNLELMRKLNNLEKEFPNNDTHWVAAAAS